MKKLLSIIVICFGLFGTIMAQNIYTAGAFQNGTHKAATVYKNGTKTYQYKKIGRDCYATKIICDSNEDVYWMVKAYSSGTLEYTQIRKNNQEYVSTENTTGIGIVDMYYLNDTLYYVGYYTNDNGIKVASVWKDQDFTPHWILGDGIHDSCIYDADIDETSDTPYFGGHLTTDKTRAVVWRENEVLFITSDEILNYNPEYIEVISSETYNISAYNDNVYTIVSYSFSVLMDRDSYTESVIMKNNVIQHTFSPLDFAGMLFAYNNDYYYRYMYPHGMVYALYQNNQCLIDALISDEFRMDNLYAYNDDIYMVGRNNSQGCIWKNFEVYQQFSNNCEELYDICIARPSFPEINTDWYYEITNDDGSTTYQYLHCAADTTIGTTRPKVIVKSNTLYDKDLHTKVTHEYVYSEDGIVYWWDKQSENYTTLYNFNANVGDEWTINVGDESITMHVDEVNYNDYEGKTYRVLTVSDEGNIFSGDIICGIGHTTSFFPEKLLNNDDFIVNGMRCYWLDGELVIQTGSVDCDEIYNIYNDVTKNEETGFEVYPNPTNGIIRIGGIDNKSEFIITNILGQIVMKGIISSDNQQIEVENLESGVYFIKVGAATIKFIRK